MSLKLKVAELLIENPELREKKAYIQSAVWGMECKSYGISSLEDFLTAYEEGILSNAESVRRVACKLMEEYPEMRATEATQKKNEEMNQHIRNNKGEL
jgi:hypothetical protein